MELTEKQLTEELVITPEAMKQAIEGIDGMLSQDKAMDILVAILDDVQPQLEKYKKEHKKHPAPITLYLWITRQAYFMGCGYGIDLYSDTVKGFIADYFGGGGRNSRTLLQASTGQNNASEGV